MVFAGCAKEVTPTMPTTPVTFEWPDKLVFLPHPTTSTSCIATVAWSPLLEEYTGIKVLIIIPKDTATQRWDWIKQHENIKWEAMLVLIM